MFHRLLPAFVSVLALSSSAAAQDVGALARERMMVAQMQRGGDTVRVQVGINFFVSGPTDDGEEADRVRDRSRRTVYEMAAGECTLLLATIAKDCRLESINVNVQRQRGSNMPDGYNTHGSLAYRIELK